MSQLPVVNAAVAVIVRSDTEQQIKQVLLAERPNGKPWAGWWEFPGGKIEAGESALEALQRELQEELGITALEAYPWLTRSFDYPDKTVKLHFFIVRHWQGEPHGKEGQILSWQNPRALNVSPMLPANTPILSALNLGHTYAITNLSETNEATFFAQLKQQLAHGLELIQIREKHLNHQDLVQFSKRVISEAKSFGAKVLLNQNIALAYELGADGVHLTSPQLLQLTEKPQNLLCAASCHNTEELNQANALGLDFVVLSPVKATLSHTEANPLGWEHFEQLARNMPMPIYALGGIQKVDLMKAWQHGAHGIAMQRGAWI